MGKDAGIVLRLLKASLFMVALLASATVLAPRASAHAASHHASMSMSQHEQNIVVDVPAADHLAFAAARQSDIPSGTPCPDGGHARHPGCCAGMASCAASCSGVIVMLPDVPNLGSPKMSPATPLMISLSVGLSAAPAEHPPRPFV
jgi:hypothetical protein